MRPRLACKNIFLTSRNLYGSKHVEFHFIKNIPETFSIYLPNGVYIANITNRKIYAELNKELENVFLRYIPHWA